MADMTKLEEKICDEIDKIAEKGITSSNLEVAYKLVDMYKDLKTIEAMEDGGYSEATRVGMDGYNDGNSYARHYVRGHYSRDNGMDYSQGRYSRNDGYSMADGRYSQAKMDYRHSRDNGSKREVMDSLEQKMQELKKELKEMSKDSDFPEERQMIEKYVDMLDRI